ncbi:hypothetical protein PMI01_04902 [Caulobacter sp. AP07]|uniref:hypothetical protein n=1 Tax=Caulobacter sp. AP07 TaxID=1144304 RepID=UPI000271F812|nr:hypothetical protein [Caulobacter sp. AP07]EJL23000.1 hypothetical protein PMI01_04902 [Caulobacter sp. AP07]
MPNHNSPSADDVVRAAIRARNLGLDTELDCSPFRMRVDEPHLHESGAWNPIWTPKPRFGDGEMDPNIKFYRRRDARNAPFRPFGDRIVVGDGRSRLATSQPLLLFAPDENNPDCLRAPVGHEWILNDAGSGNARDISYWRLIPPQGYTALGAVFGVEQPDYNNYWCVKNEYLAPGARIAAWNRESSWRHNGNLSKPIVPQGVSPPDGEVMWLAPQTFLSDQGQQPAKLLRAGLPTLQVVPFDIEPPSDPNVAVGDETAPGLGKVVIAPRMIVRLDSDWEASYSRDFHYAIACQPYWRCDEVWRGAASSVQMMTVTVGVDQAASDAFARQTSLRAGCKVGLVVDAANPYASASFTTALSIPTENFPKSTLSSRPLSVDLPPRGNVVALWSRHLRIVVYDSGGEIVSEVRYATGKWTLRY